MPEEEKTEAQLLRDRKHEILSARASTIQNNLLAWKGGKPYIQARLSRWPAEDDVSWAGDAGKGILGRPDRAYLVNYSQRIIQKINQLVFSEAVERTGIDDEFRVDCTSTGQTITQVMTEASSIFTAAGWGWLSADRGRVPTDPSTGAPAPVSVASRQASGDRVFWQVWLPEEVQDWCFDHAGVLKWLKTAQVVYRNDDPRVLPSQVKVVTLWERDQVTRWDWPLTESKEGEAEPAPEVIPWPSGVVPFVPVGIPTDAVHWFDSVELIQASLLNLASCHDENLCTAGFPQLVVPASLISQIMTLTGKSADDSMELVRGLRHPVMEPDESKGISRYLSPTVGSERAIPGEIDRRVKELFDMLGLALANPNSQQIQSAESKKLDMLDPKAVLRGQAMTLQDAELKLAQYSKELDSGFKAWEPAYADDFETSDLKADMETLQGILTMDMPDEAVKEVLRLGVELMDRVRSIPPDRKKTILDSIEEFDSGLLRAMTDVAPGGPASPTPGPAQGLGDAAGEA